MSLQVQNRIVLLVEDSDDDAFFFERAFANAGVSGLLIHVSNGGEAIKYLESATRDSLDLFQSHVVFLDLKMPILNGFDVLKWIRERGIAVEVVVLSGSDIESDMEQARALGAADYLVKPILPPELKKRLMREEVGK
jgi:CheY-like chemotaxis protein